MKKNIDSKSPFERLPASVFSSSEAAAIRVAREIADLIRERQEQGLKVVLGLATGSTPVPVYREWIRMHREEGFSFANVVSFNLDEYYPLSRTHRESYWRFMQDQLFAHIDIPEEQVHVPNGEVGRDKAFEDCQEYEQRIADAGGIDIQILGIGRTGHIGFNEPGSGIDSRTRLVTLDELTRRDAARDFLGENNVPRYAITMGVGTIMEARKILLLAWGRAKAGVIRKALEEAPTDHIPASYLQSHPNAEFVLDEAAASLLTRYTEPWRVGFVDWTPELVRRAVLGLCQKVDKPILKLVDKDYNEHGLADLLTVKGSAYQLNIHIFNVLQHTITGWPGGKPDADDSARPERAQPAQKRVLILASEPQEDILGLGGTIRRLCDQGHEVTIAYATSGDLAVPDQEAKAALELLQDLGDLGGGLDAGSIQEQIKDLGKKDILDFDSETVRVVKAAIREGEARQSARQLGLSQKILRFLRMPFYRKGHYRRFRLEEEDFAMLQQLLQELKPHQIFVSGSHDDPSSVSGLTFRALREAFARCSESEEWPQHTYVWMYRGSGEEWPVDRIDMAVPLSPGELNRKVIAALQHRSQHSQSPNALLEQSESWQRTEHLNRRTAELYDRLGMAEYEAIECFVRWRS
ncbi:MAG: glucosamine-6-phosphate deaminase [Opitutales bacterium]|nr:glucosamine-6-phosphate deaminase [Opitutales bacterium]